VESLEDVELVETRRRDLRVSAALASAVVIGAFLVYWFLQIQDVRELLEMAYG
jgi:hypothetical protein